MRRNEGIFVCFSSAQQGQGRYSRTWYLSSDMPTRKYEKTDRANEIYKSELGLPIIPTSTERSISPRSEVGTSHLFAFGSTGNFQLRKCKRLTESIYFVRN